MTIIVFNGTSGRALMVQVLHRELWAEHGCHTHPEILMACCCRDAAHTPSNVVGTVADRQKQLLENLNESGGPAFSSQLEHSEGSQGAHSGDCCFSISMIDLHIGKKWLLSCAFPVAPLQKVG
eukprot:624257-Pelagomonas_calceolata.AAC.7